MPWVKLDDSFHDHPKVLRAGLPAIGLHVVALTHCSRYLTDGHVSPEFVSQKAGKNGQKIAAALVTAGLWTVNDRGWTIHDYLDYNPSRTQVVETRRKESERKARGRA